jgi:hypothetical protein
MRGGSGVVGGEVRKEEDSGGRDGKRVGERERKEKGGIMKKARRA